MSAFEEIAVVAEWLHRTHEVPKRRAVRAAGNGYLRAKGRKRKPEQREQVIGAAAPRLIGEQLVIELAARNGHHIAGTDYNWRHGWIPLNVATALLHRKRRAAEKLHAEGAPFADDAGSLRSLGGLSARGPRDMSDDELDTAMQDAIAREDFGHLDRLGDETDRRDAERAKRQAKADSERIRRQERADRMLDRMGALIDEGVAEDEAYAEVYGGTPEQFRRKQAISELRHLGYEGAGFDELARASFADHVAQEYLRAEQDTNGVMLSRDAEGANARAAVKRGVLIDPEQLFRGTEATARKHASEELRRWWDANGRPSLAEWKADLIGDTGRARGLRARRGTMHA